MGETPGTLQLRIELDGYVMPGAKEAQEQMAGGAKKLADEMGVVSVSGKEVEKILGKGGEAAEMSHLSMRRLAHAMGSEIPGGAALMESAFTSAEGGMTSATFLLLAGVEMLRGAIEKINKEREQSRRLSEELADADAQTTKVVDAQREALDKAEVAEAEFHHNYTRNAHDAVAAAEKLADAVAKASFSQAEGGDSKHKSIAEKGVEDLEHRGVISHAAAVQLKEQIDLEYEARKLQRQAAQDRLEEAALARQLGNKQIAARNDLTAEAGAEGKYASAAQAKAANDARREEAERKIQSGEEVKKSLRETGVTDENIQKLKASYEKTSGLPSDGAGAASLSEMFTYLSRHAGGIVPRKLFGTEGDVNLATYSGAQLDIDAGKLELTRARQKQGPLDIAEGNAKSDLELARQRADKDRNSVEDLSENLAVKKATDAMREQGARRDFGLDAAAHMLQGHAQTIGNFMGQVNRLADAMQHMSPDAVNNLARRVDQLQSQIGNQRNNYGA